MSTENTDKKERFSYVGPHYKTYLLTNEIGKCNPKKMLKKEVIKLVEKYPSLARLWVGLN